MGNTYRRNKRTGMRERDGYRAAISAGCEHNNWCPWCRGNRTYRNQWLEEKKKQEFEMYNSGQYWSWWDEYADEVFRAMDLSFDIYNYGRWRDFYSGNDIYNWEDAEYADYVNGKYS